MAKELPYFKFEPNQWENGNIQACSRELKGLFIDICSMYWSRLGDLSYKLVLQKLCGGNATALNSLCEEKILEVIEGNIFIKFLSEQLDEFEDISNKNRDNAKIGWEKRRTAKALSERNATASNSQCQNDAIREEEIRKEKIILEKSLLSEIKISDDNIFLLYKEKKTEVSKETIFYFKTAISFQLLFIKNLKEKESPTTQLELANFKNFVEPIRLMFEKDKITSIQIRQAYDFLNSKEGDFWKSNILSTKKLRDKISVLLAKANTSVNSAKQNTIIPDPNKRKRIT